MKNLWKDLSLNQYFSCATIGDLAEKLKEKEQ
jgi:hypothetical protein